MNLAPASLNNLMSNENNFLKRTINGEIKVLQSGIAAATYVTAKFNLANYQVPVDKVLKCYGIKVIGRGAGSDLEIMAVGYGDTAVSGGAKPTTPIDENLYLLVTNAGVASFYDLYFEVPAGKYMFAGGTALQKCQVTYYCVLEDV